MDFESVGVHSFHVYLAFHCMSSFPASLISSLKYGISYMK